MTETSGKRDSTSLRITTSNEIVKIKRGRGRPPGAKNKPKSLSIADEPKVKRGRGRPKGAKNKPKEQAAQLEVKYKEQSVPLDIQPKKRGRPPKVKVENAQPPEVQEKQLTDHPLLEAVRWIEKSMHQTELHYYRSRASRAGVSLHVAMASDILGFFNVQDPEINKQIKKNNFIANTSNGIRN